MESFRHSIRKQSLKILVDSQETALLLQPRIDEMNRRYLLPAIERALNELDVPGKHVRIASLSVDLGKLPVSELDLSLPERLYLRVCEALKQTLFRAEEGPAPGVSLQSEQASRLELLEHFLVHGTLPFWAPGSAASSLDELLLELEEQTPESLARVLRKCGTQNRVRERMVRQFREPLLQRLLRLLEPENAALILAYIFDLEKTHRAQPVLGLGDTEFARLIWLVVLAYVMQEPGSQFNRKSFVKSLLTGMAEAEGLAYQEMLHILYMGLEQTGRRLPLHSSLPIVIRELARDLGERPGMAPVKHPGAAATNPGDARDDHIEDELDGTPGTAVAGLGPHAASAEDGRQLESLRFFLLHGELPAWATGADGFALQEFLLQLAEDDPDGLVGMIRSCGVQASVRQRLVTQLDRPVLQQLLHLLEPVHAGLIIAYVVDLNEIHRTEPLLPVAGEKFDVILWTLVLAYVLHNPGSQFNRKTFVKTLLENMSLAEGLAYQDVLRILHLGVKRTLKKLTLHSSLPMTIEELASSLKLMPTPGSMVLQHSRSDRQESSTGAESRETGEPGGERFSAHDTSVAPRLELSHYSLTEGLRYYLEHGVLPWGLLVRWPGATAARMMNFLRRMPVAEMESMLRQAAPEKQLAMLLRAARTLPEEHLPFLMQLVLPQAAEQHQLLHEAVERFAASAKDKRTFYSRLITAVLEKQPLDLEEFVGTGPGHPQPAPSSLPEDPAAWEAHALKSVMLSRLRSADFESDTYPPQPELLQALVSKHPQEGRHFLHVLRSRPAQLSSVVEHCPAALVVPILKLARPADAAMIDSLMQALSRVGSNHRPSGEDAVRRTILAEVLQLPPGEDMGQDFFARVLEKLFEVPLADPICRELRRQVAEIRSSNRFPTPQIDALDSTIETASSPDALARLTREKNCTSIPFTPASLGPMPAAREAVFSFLLGETRKHSLDDRDPGVAGTSEPCSLEQYSVDTLQHELQAMIEEAPQELRAVTERYIKDAEKRERWTTIFPESSLAGLVRLLEPRKHRALLDTAEVLAAAWQEAASPSMPESTRNFMWSFLFDFLARNRETDRSTARMIGAFFEHVAQHAKGTAAGQAALAAMGSSLLESCARLARASGRSHLLSILARNRRLLRPFGNPSAPPPSSEDPGSLHGNKARSQPARGPVRDRTAFTLGRDVSEGGAADAIYIANAGLVLAGTFLPHLFESLNLLDDDASGRRRIRSGEAASRAVHLLQYLADGSCSTPEPLLVLNKIMCGLALETPVSREIELNDHERDLCEQLLRAMIANWSVISNTSIAGLRETFLQREGKLEHAAEGWRLQIQRKTLDILVDQISWSMSVIYHRWMLEPLYVKW